jgi:hypothetical protein
VNAGGKLVHNYLLHEWKQNLQAQANGKLFSSSTSLLEHLGHLSVMPRNTLMPTFINL